MASVHCKPSVLALSQPLNLFWEEIQLDAFPLILAIKFYSVVVLLRPEFAQATSSAIIFLIKRFEEQRERNNPCAHFYTSLPAFYLACTHLSIIHTTVGFNAKHFFGIILRTLISVRDLKNHAKSLLDENQSNKFKKMVTGCRLLL